MLHQSVKRVKTESQKVLEANSYTLNRVKGRLSSLKHFLATESPLKMIKNAFGFTLKALFVLKMFKFLS